MLLGSGQRAYSGSIIKNLLESKKNQTLDGLSIFSKRMEYSWRYATKQFSIINTETMISILPLAYSVIEKHRRKEDE